MSGETVGNNTNHRVYILHAWHEEDLSECRYVLVDPLTAQRRGFDGLEALMAFLAAEATPPNCVPGENSGSLVGAGSPDLS